MGWEKRKDHSVQLPLSSYHFPGTVVDPEDAAGNTTGRGFCPQVLVEKKKKWHEN